MSFSGLRYVYFLGIGGIGMSALARFFNVMGLKVSGYDKTQTDLTNALADEGIEIHYSEDPTYLTQLMAKEKLNQENTLIVHTPAIPSNHAEWPVIKASGLTLMKRSEVLGQLTAAAYTIAVAGTHGKTTTSSIITHLLKHAGVDCSAFLGGIMNNYHTNFLLSSDLKNNQYGLNIKCPIVVEADEYDRSFLQLSPYISVITSLDADHLDIYANKEAMDQAYSKFAGQFRPGGRLIVNRRVEQGLNYVGLYTTYSIDQPADYMAKNISIQGGNYIFDICTPTRTIPAIALGLPGLHNVENAIAAIAAVDTFNLSDEVLRQGLKTFQGVKRRFDYKIRTEELVYIDDYAHHPAELKACILSVKQLYPDRKIVGVFQPHLYSRTRDFADDFAASLDYLDTCLLLEIYPARELPIPGIDAQYLLNKMKLNDKKLCSKAEIINELQQRNPQVIVTLGAGDIDQLVDPIKNHFNKQQTA